MHHIDVIFKSKPGGAHVLPSSPSLQSPWRTVMLTLWNLYFLSRFNLSETEAENRHRGPTISGKSYSIYLNATSLVRQALLSLYFQGEDGGWEGWRELCKPACDSRPRSLPELPSFMATGCGAGNKLERCQNMISRLEWARGGGGGRVTPQSIPTPR